MSTNSDFAAPVVAQESGVIEYATIRESDVSTAGEAARSRGIRGTEVFMDDIKTRTLKLAETPEERAALLSTLQNAEVRRIHSSYWAAPTAFVGNVKYGELVERFEGTEPMREYFGDLTGEHMFSRWRDEYALACDLNADAFVFHLIDYMPADGAWAFTVDRQVVLDAMIVLTQQFLRVLENDNLVNESSPVIELESAGWGLEFGAQTADDFAQVFAKVHDSANRLRLGWDLNHLLHATGIDGDRGVFMLPEAERTSAMAEIEQHSNGSIQEFSMAWIAHNVLDERTVGKVSALHISDCTPKSVEYFSNGVLHEDYAVEGDWDALKDEGLRIVLTHYDNHVLLGEGALDPAAVRELIRTLAAKNPLMVLHELKNEADIWAAVDTQRATLALPERGA